MAKASACYTSKMGAILKGSGFHAFCEAIREEEFANGDAMASAISILEAGIEKTMKRNPLLLGWDVKRKKKRIAKAMWYVYACHMGAAQGAVAMQRVHQEIFSTPAAAEITSDMFDPTH